MAFNSMIDYTLVRSKRKTIALYLRDDTSIEVRAPFGAPKREIDAFVESKAGWISKNTALCQELNASRVDYVLGYGSLVTYRGKDYPLESKPGNRCGFDDERFFVPPNLTSGQIRSAATLVYRMLAKRDLSVKTQEYARLMGVTPAAVKVSNASRRWGSCSRKKSLNFAWRLIMADDDAIDYVVVHELAHLTEMNHSPRFWAIVEGIFPDYRERKSKLKDLQGKLKTEGWC